MKFLLSYFIVLFLFWTDPLACNPTSKMDLSQTQHPSEETVKTGNIKGRLLESSKLVNKAALDRRFLEDLKNEKVGTLRIESEALRLNEDSAKYRKNRGKRMKRGDDGGVVDRIRSTRDPDKVLDLLKWKLRYAAKEERRLKKEYVKIKEEATRELNAGALRRLVRMVAKETERRWNRVMDKIRKRVDWSKRKFIVISLTESQKWVKRIAAGNGIQRKRVRLGVPTYGDVTLDEDEEAVLSLPPKFAMFRKFRRKTSR